MQRLVVKRNRFLAETPKPKQGPREKPKFWPKPKFRPIHIFGRNSLFRLKYLISAKKAVLANDFLLKCAAKISRNKVFRPKQAVSAENSVSAETPKKGENRNTETEIETGRNFRPKPTQTVSVCPLL